MDFDQLYAERLQEPLRQLEFPRKSLRRKALAGILFMLAGIICLLIFVINRDGARLIIIPSMILIVGSLMTGLFYYTAKAEYTNAYKKIIIAEIMHAVEPECTYEPDNRVEENEYRRSGLFTGRYDRYSGEDYVSGKRGSTTFHFSELHTEQRISDNNYDDVFRGIFFAADFNKYFHSRTYVWNESNPQYTIFTRFLNGSISGIEKVKLESPDFEDCFTVYSTDQVEARYILSPAMMNRLTGLQLSLGRNLSFSFVSNSVFAAIPYDGNLFEPGIFSSPDANGLRDYYEIVRQTIGIVDDLDLNTRIWSKP